MASSQRSKEFWHLHLKWEERRRTRREKEQIHAKPPAWKKDTLFTILTGRNYQSLNWCGRSRETVVPPHEFCVQRVSLWRMKEKTLAKTKKLQGVVSNKQKHDHNSFTRRRQDCSDQLTVKHRATICNDSTIATKISHNVWSSVPFFYKSNIQL